MRIFALLLLLSFLLVSCGDEKPQPISETQWKIFSYLPSDTQFLMYTNLEALRKTEHWENFIKPSLQSNRADNWLKEFEDSTGAGFSNGVSEVYTATGWNGNDIFVITFNKNAERVRKYFDNPDKFKFEEDSGKKIYFLKSNPESRFCFVNDKTLLISKNKDYLIQAVTGQNQSLKENKKIIAIIQEIRSKNQYWIATTQGSFATAILQKFFGDRRDLPANKLLNSLDNITMAAEFSDGVRLESSLGCKDRKSALLLTAAIRSAIAMDILSDSNYELGKIIQKLEINHSEKNVNLELNINEKDIRELQDITRKRQTDKKL